MESSIAPQPKRPGKKPTQAMFAKVFHWVNILSLLLMMASGLRIYAANPVFGGRDGLRLPKFLEFLMIGDGLAQGRDWHFAIMWVYSLNLLGYGLFILFTKRWKHRFADGGDLKVIRVSANEKRRNYAWHRLVYTSIVPILLLSIASGLAMYKPVQFAWLAALFRDWQTLRVVHFTTVPIVLIFTFVHSCMALTVGGKRLVKSMFLA
jgi:thiosulfate reductase cytochrome b subunit